MSWRGVAGKMANDPSNNNAFRKRRNGNRGLGTLDSLYYDYTCERLGKSEVSVNGTCKE